MTTFTATPDPAGRFIAVELADVTADSVATITRDPVVGDLLTVRGTPRELTAGGAVVLTDVEYPIGQPLTYTATLRDPTSAALLETLTATAPATEPDGAGVVVSDPLTGLEVRVDVHDEHDETHEPRRYVYQLAGTRRPLIVSDVHTAPTWKLDIRTDSINERDALLALLTERAAPVLLRAPASDDIRQGWAHPGRVDVARLSIPATDTRRLITVELTGADPPDSTIEAVAVTLADLHDYEPTDLETLAGRPPATLLELSRAVVTYA